MSRLTSDKRVLEYDLNSLYSNIFCFSTTRHGGVSSGNYSSFNCNEYCGDNIENVIDNRNILITLLPQKPEKLVFPHQTHGTEVAIIDKDYIAKSEDEQRVILEGVDALITNLKNICLCISTADCIPILLFDSKNNIVSAIHAGWRGTVNRIVEKCITLMRDKFHTDPNDLFACIGPGISLDNFEVGNEVYDEFYNKNFDVNQISFLNKLTGKWHLDLSKANEIELIKVGVKRENIEYSYICTYNNNETFFSARRQGINSGRILSGIMLLSNVRS